MLNVLNADQQNPCQGLYDKNYLLINIKLKELKKLSRNELKSIEGGFTCYCGGKNLGEYSSM